MSQIVTRPVVRRVLIAPSTRNVVVRSGGPQGPGVPPGGDATQILAKASNDDLDLEWVDAPDGTGGALPPLDPSPEGSYRTPRLTFNDRGQATAAVRNDNIATRNEAMLILASVRKLSANVLSISLGGVSGGPRT